MFKISKKTTDRFAATLKNFQSIAASHKARDVSEADTVTLIKDVLAETFGYDKYVELTSEQQIRGTFCDLAIKIDGKIRVLIEVKAAGIDLNEGHLRQAITYGANQGIEWVVLTNALDWRLYKIKFGQPIDYEVLSSFSLPSINLRNEDDVRKLFLLSREGVTSEAMSAFHQHTQFINKFTVAQILLSDAIIYQMRREMRRLFPDVKIEIDALKDILMQEVLKREVVEGDKAKETESRIKKALSKLARQATKKPEGTNEPATPSDAEEPETEA